MKNFLSIFLISAVLWVQYEPSGIIDATVTGDSDKAPPIAEPRLQAHFPLYMPTENMRIDITKKSPALIRSKIKQ